MAPISRLAALAMLVVGYSVAACSPPPGEASAAGETVRPGPAPAAPENVLLIGTSKAALLACAGAPAAVADTAGVEYLTYRTERTVGAGYLLSAPRIPVIGSLALGGKGSVVSCEVTLVLRNGAVEAASLRADPEQDTTTTAALCRPLIEPCMSR